MATSGNDVLIGTPGPDLLDGLTGEDLMSGGLGDDTYVVDNPNDAVVENDNAGRDTVESSIDYALPANVEILRLTGTGDISGYGNELGNELYGNAGMNSLFGYESGDLLDGGDGNDSLDSDGGDDFVYGGAGDDYIDSGDGSDYVDGGTGNDSLSGGNGDDTYVFGRGYGQDVAYDSDGTDRVLLTGGLSVSDVSLARIGNDLAVTITGTTDRLLLLEWFSGSSQVETFQFDDGAVASAATIVQALDNQAPTAGDDFAAVTVGEATVATGTVLWNDSDSNESDVLAVANPGTYQGTFGTLVLGADGAYTYTIDPGLPAVQALGAGEDATDRFTYTATDGVPFATGTATANLTVTVTGAAAPPPPNHAPVLEAPLGDQSADAGQAFEFSFPMESFSDADALDYLEYGATLVDGTPLPGWLEFDAAAGRFTGTAPDALGGTALEIKVTASDLFGATASDVFAFNIAGRPAGTPGRGLELIGTPRRDRLVGSPFDDRIDGRGDHDVMIGGNGNDTYFVDGAHGRRGHRVDRVVERANEGHDAVYSKASFRLPAHVEDLHLLGSRNLDGTGNAQANWIEGNRGRNRLKGGAGDDLLQGMGGRDELRGGAGIDVLQGGRGRDTLVDRCGPTVFDGGRGNDSMTGGASADFFAGGRGDDLLRLGGGDDVIAFRRGDGTDRIAGERQDAVLVLGGVRYQDLLFRKDGGDLVLDLGGHDRLVFDDWYRGKQSVATLEVIGAPSADHDVEVFDFRALVQAFDEARTAKRNMKSWALMNELLDAHLASSDDLALGGELAYRYATTGTLAGMGWNAARDTVAAPGFGSEMQALQPAAALASDALKLGA